MGSEVAISGGYHGCRWDESSQIGWQNLPVPERDIVLVLVLSVGGEAAASMGRQGSNKRYHCFGSMGEEARRLDKSSKIEGQAKGKKRREGKGRGGRRFNNDEHCPTASLCFCSN